jgi:hypothetical protein
MAELPKTATGKIRRNVLRDVLGSGPAPGPVAQDPPAPEPVPPAATPTAGTRSIARSRG